MNNWLLVALITALVTAIGVGSIVGVMNSQPRFPAVPQLFKVNNLAPIIQVYRQAMYPVSDQQAVIMTLTGWRTRFGTKALVTTGRFLYKGKIVMYRRWRVIEPNPATYPFLIQFDTNGDGVFSAAESGIWVGSPLMTSPTPLPVYLQGLKGEGLQTAPSASQ